MLSPVLQAAGRWHMKFVHTLSLQHANDNDRRLIGNGTSGIQLDPPEIIFPEINSMEPGVSRHYYTRKTDRGNAARAKTATRGVDETAPRAACLTALIGVRKSIAALNAALTHENVLVRVAAASGLNKLRVDKREGYTPSIKPAFAQSVGRQRHGGCTTGFASISALDIPNLRHNVDNLR